MYRETEGDIRSADPAHGCVGADAALVKSFGGLTYDRFVEITRSLMKCALISLRPKPKCWTSNNGVCLSTPRLREMKRVVHGVRADKEEGEDGELYAAMEVVRRSDRSSGLTRRRVKKASEKPEEAAS